MEIWQTQTLKGAISGFAKSPSLIKLFRPLFFVKLVYERRDLKAG